MIRSAIALTLAASLAAAGPAAAARLFTAGLDGPTAGSTSAATGTAELILNDDETQISYTITYTGLESEEVFAHFHNAAAGINGPVVHTLPLGTPKFGTWDVTPADVAELDAGRIYVLVHSQSWFAGEIRGQVGYTSVAADTPTWGGIKSLFR